MIVAGKSGDLATAARPANPWSAFSTLSRDTFTGRNVAPEDALALSYVYGAVSLIANLGGTMPLEVVDERDGAHTVVKRGEIATTLGHAPNAEMTAPDVWSLVLAHLCLRGNSYLAKLPSKDRPLYGELVPLNPAHVTPFWSEDGVKMFAVQSFDSESRYAPRYYTAKDVLHIKGPSFNAGLVGASPIAVMRNRLGVHLSQSEYQARFYQQGYQLKGVLSTDAANLTAEAAQRMKDQWRSTYGGMENSHDIAILHSGLKFQPVSLNMEDAQFIETMRWGATEIATAFNIPASRLNGEGASNTYANAAQDDLVLYKQAIMPRLKLIEAALNADTALFGPTSPWVPRFNADSVLRADIEQRYRAYEIGVRNRWLTVNEVRRGEDLPPVKGGDELAPVTQPVAAREEQRGAGQTIINIPERSVVVEPAAAPHVHVDVTPDVRIEGPAAPNVQVDVHVPQQESPVVNISPPVVNVAPADVRVSPRVEVTPRPARGVKFERNHLGVISGLVVEED